MKNSSLILFVVIEETPIEEPPVEPIDVDEERDAPPTDFEGSWSERERGDQLLLSEHLKIKGMNANRCNSMIVY